MPIKANDPNYLSKIIISDHYIRQHFAKYMLEAYQHMQPDMSQKRPNTNKSIEAVFNAAMEVIDNDFDYLKKCATVLNDELKKKYIDQMTIELRNTELDIMPIIQNLSDPKVAKKVKDYQHWNKIDWSKISDQNVKNVENYVELGLKCETAFFNAVQKA